MIDLHRKLKRHLQGQELSLGSWLMSRDPIMAEVLAAAGFDWLVVDMEHGPITLSEAADLIRVATARGCPTLVRLPSHDLVLAKQVLDAGASGVIVPDVRTSEQAARLAEGVRYPRDGYGSRGVGLGRATGYGRSFDEYFAGWNAAVTVVAQIEHVSAIAHATAIAAVDGIDALFVGPYDLSASMGIAGQLSNPELMKSVDAVVAAAKSAGKRSGFHSVPVDSQAALSLIKRGASLIAFSADVFMVRHCADEFLRAARRESNGPV